jgi:ribosomal RNA-processing protein 36
LETDPAQSNASEDESHRPKVDLSSISFGALARAQESLPPTDRKSKKSQAASKSIDMADGAPQPRIPKSKSDQKVKPPSRSSKHAPLEQTSKRAVSRRREILPDLRRQPRDPRFGPLGGGGAQFDEAKARKAYAFLDDYRDSEMAELRLQIKKTKDPARKEDLKRELHSMESKKKARLRKEEQDNLLREHRKQEKELVAQGKKPFYLKKSEQKKQLLTERFKSMSKGQVDRAIERKRKKVAGKEKKELDSLQRVRNR